MGLPIRRTKAYELYARAETLESKGDLEQARKMMIEAADLDKSYSIRATYLGQTDVRRISPTSTIKRLLIPCLFEKGFFPREGGKNWNPGKTLIRHGTNVEHFIIIGIPKFGRSISVLASKCEPGGEAKYFEWTVVGILTGSLAYSSQTELEASCQKWLELINSHVFPWLLNLA